MTQALQERPITLPTPRAIEYLYYPPTLGHISAARYVASSVMQLPFYGIISLSADGKDPRRTNHLSR